MVDPTFGEACVLLDLACEPIVEVLSDVGIERLSKLASLSISFSVVFAVVFWVSVELNIVAQLLLEGASKCGSERTMTDSVVSIVGDGSCKMSCVKSELSELIVCVSFR